VYGGAGTAIVPVPLLRTASAPTSGSAGRAVGVAYLTLKVHVPPTASGVVKEQVFRGTEYSVPMLTRRFSAVIVKGALPVLVTVTTLVTAARGAGIVNVRVRTPNTVVSVPLVAAVKVKVPCGAVTVNVTVLLVPPGVVTLTVLAPSAAVAAIVKVVVTVVAVTVKAPAVTPVPDTVTAVAPVRFVPVKVTVPVVPCARDEGAIEVSVGGAEVAPAVNSTAPASTDPFFLEVPKKSVAGASL